MNDIVEHPFAQYIRILGKGKTGTRSLDMQEAFDAFTMLLEGNIKPNQLGAFMMLLRVKEETPEEIAGFASACKSYINAPRDIAVDIDWSSYAGKRKQLPWFIACLLVLANQGYRIFIHGTKGHTSGRLYTEDAFRSLGLPIASSWEDARNHLDAKNICYMPMATICPVLQDIIDMRNDFGLRSPVHTLSRLINPLDAPCSFQSIFHPAYASIHQQAASLLGQSAMAVFKGESGEVERKPEATCLVKQVGNGKLFEETWPRLLEGKQVQETELDLLIFKQVWRGELEHHYAQAAITGTLAIILKLIKKLDSQDEALEIASSLWNSRDTRYLQDHAS